MSQGPLPGLMLFSNNPNWGTQNNLIKYTQAVRLNFSGHLQQHITLNDCEMKCNQRQY